PGAPSPRPRRPTGSTAPGGDALGGRDVLLLVAHRHALDVSHRTDRHLDVPRVGGAVELEHELAVEVVGLECRGRRLHPLNDAEALHLADDQRGAAARFLERIGGAEQELERVLARRLAAATQMVEQILHAMGEIGHAAVAHRRRHALDGMDGAENAADRLRRGGMTLPLEQQLIAGAQVLAALGQEPPGVLRQVHRYPRTRWTASRTREGWKGLTTKSLAPAWIASTTSACCPMALHMRILASGSCLTISRTASIPAMSGITVSIVPRSGLSCLYLSTAWLPVSASPTTSNPAWAR